MDKRKKSLSFLEILVSAIILATCIAGLLASFVVVRKAVLRSDKRLAAYNLARQQVEVLYPEVREDTWDTGALQEPFTSSWTTVTLPPENIDFKRQYTVSAPAGAGACASCEHRQVNVTVEFPQ